MSVIVYIWEHDRHSSWGHASMWVRPGPYISWWPSSDEERKYSINKKKHPSLAKVVQKFIGTTNIYKVKHRVANSLIQDVEFESKQPQHKIEIADGVLDEDAIALWWKGYNYETASFHSIKKNCSTTVIRGLRAGGSDRYAFLVADNLTKRSGWEPTDVYAYLKRMAKSVGEGRMTFTRNPSFQAETVLWGALNNEGGGGEDNSGGGGGNLCHHGWNMYECPNC